MMLAIGKGKTIKQSEIIAIVPSLAHKKEQSSIFAEDGTVVLSPVSARTLHKRMERPASQITFVRQLTK